MNPRFSISEGVAMSSFTRSGVIARNLKEARAACPGVSVSDEIFARYVAERLQSNGVLDLGLVERHTGDLFLACACSHGDAGAIALFEQLYFAAEVDAACRRSGRIAPDEMRQRVRAKLFVGPSPKIASYVGRSSLRTWLRAVVGRLLIDASRERVRDVPTPEVDFSVLAFKGDDPDRELVKRTYRAALEGAFVDAAERLSPKDKNLLHYGLAQSLNIDQIGRIYGVHRVTAARWLQKARASFVEQIRAVVMERMQLTASEFDSVLRLVVSEIDVTIARVFSTVLPA
jgi:RNA polymerase sigma-70 factor (ECF subfamily)